MENNNQNTELELMRSQMEDFKAQLDKQKIVNEKMIIGSMKKSMSWIKRYVYFECCLVPLIDFGFCKQVIRCILLREE